MAECVHLSISSFNRTSFSWKHPYTPPGEYGPAWYRCNTMNNTQESNIVCSSQWGQTGHSKYWSRDMWRGYTIYRPTAGHCLLCMCFRENQENIALFKSDNDSTYSNAVVAIFENGSYTAYIHLKAEWMGNWELHFQTVHDMLPCLQHLGTHTHDMQRLYTDTNKRCFFWQKLIQMPIGHSWNDTMCCDALTRFGQDCTHT